MKRMNLSEIYADILAESVSRDALLKAMESRKRISIYYDSPYGTEDKGWRRIEPYCYGLNNSDNMVLRAYQINGASDTPNGKPNDPLTKIPGWRMFRIDGIKNVNFGGGDTFDEPRQGYNAKDKDMKTIYRSVSFDDIVNPDDALRNDDDAVNKSPETISTPDSGQDTLNVDAPNDAVSGEKSPTAFDGDTDKRLRDKPDWLKKFISRFKDLVNYKK